LSVITIYAASGMVCPHCRTKTIVSHEHQRCTNCNHEVHGPTHVCPEVRTERERLHADAKAHADRLAADPIARLTAEVKALREILARSVEAAGGGASTEASLEFFKHLPDDIRLRIAGAKATATAQAWDKTRAIEMHRRAQRLEGIEAHMDTLRASHLREVAQLRLSGWETKQFWKKRYAAATEQIRAAGIDATITIDGRTMRCGYLDVMIERLIAAWQKSQAEAEEMRTALVAYVKAEEALNTLPPGEARVAAHRERMMALLVLEDVGCKVAGMPPLCGIPADRVVQKEAVP
jgi:hypothetical protein